jgi:hemerythrin superfamily protein
MASMDAISMLKDDHKTVEQLFKRFEKAGDRAHVEKREVVDRIIEELSVHAAIEEQLFYPVVRSTVPETEDIALESLEEHHIVKWVLSELETMTSENERFDAKVTVLIENVRHHVEEEEDEFFPMVRGELSRNALNDLGDAMAAAKKVAPTHPHPRSPDTPPGNLVVGTAAGVADRIGDTVSGLTQGGVTAVGDIIATVLRRKKPRVSPTGSKTTRSTAAQVRSAASDATAAAIEATRKAKRAGKRTARTAGTTGSSAKASAKRTAGAVKRGGTSTPRAAKAGVKGTATSARTSTKRAVAAAKRGATATGRTAHKAANSTATTAKR